jgi:hypothetical protein
MTEAAGPNPPPTKATLPPISDTRFGFLTQEWLNPPKSVLNSLKTAEEQYQMLADDDAYRQTVSPTSWSRYVNLGRPTTNGFNFDKIWNNFESDPSLLYQLIWYTFLYCVDRKLDLPPKLDLWATMTAQPYLAIHLPKILTIDTQHTTWSMIQSVHEPWVKIGHSKRTADQIQKSTSVSKPKSIPTNNTLLRLLPPMTPNLPKNIPPIPEETETENKATEEKNDTISKTSPVSKQSAIIPNLNVPMNDGTHRVTIRMKTTSDTTDMEKTKTEIQNTTLELLSALFSEEDGYIYRWSRDELKDPKVIEDMSVSQLLSYMPAITIIPAQSLVILTLRFGFQNQNPTAWRNKIITKDILKDFQASVSFSNSISTSRKLVIAGYILLKSPNLTHRIKYLQSLRSQMPKTTPGFDILLHRRTPTEQKIDHLVVQCGENHVHPLSNALLNILDGKTAGVYVPRFAFATMTPTEVIDIFAKHDNYVKTQKMIPLSPFITNLDTLRLEHGEKTIERTTRKWASTLKLEDGSNAKCDVVNGGFDQREYLLVPPQNESVAKKAFESYKSRVFPFSQREARFRDNIGPPEVIHISPKVKSSLEVFKSLSASEVWQRAPEAVRQDKATSTLEHRNIDHSSISLSTSNNSVSTKSTTHQNQQQYAKFPHSSKRSQGIQKSVQDEETTNETTSTQSDKTSAMNSAYQTRLHELEVTIQRQEKENEKSAKDTSERLRKLERQLHRLDSLEEKMVKSLDSQLALANNMNQMKDQFQQQMDALITVVTNQAAAVPRNQTTVTYQEHKTKT